MSVGGSNNSKHTGGGLQKQEGCRGSGTGLCEEGFVSCWDKRLILDSNLSTEMAEEKGHQIPS